MVMGSPITITPVGRIQEKPTLTTRVFTSVYDNLHVFLGWEFNPKRFSEIRKLQVFLNTKSQCHEILFYEYYPNEEEDINGVLIPVVATQTSFDEDLVKVKVTTLSGSAEEETINTGNYNTNPTALAVSEDIKIRLKHVTGVPVLLYISKKWGKVCTSCWDGASNYPTPKKSCTRCYGTGFLGGYFDPIKIWVSFPAPKIKNVRMGAPSYSTLDTPVIQAPAYPIISISDILYVVYSGKAYKVQEVQEIQHRGITVSHQLTTTLLKKDSDFYLLKQDLGLISEFSREYRKVSRYYSRIIG